MDEVAYKGKRWEITSAKQDGSTWSYEMRKLASSTTATVKQKDIEGIQKMGPLHPRPG
jgi:hypothetical protein